MANLYVKAVPPPDMNRNTEWFMYPGVWTTYILILFFSWLVVLSVSGCSPGMAWTVVNLAHFLVSLLSWMCLFLFTCAFWIGWLIDFVELFCVFDFLRSGFESPNEFIITVSWLGFELRCSYVLILNWSVWLS